MHIPAVKRNGEVTSGISSEASGNGATPDVPEAMRLVPVIRPLAGRVLLGSLLTFLTFGIYRFWYRTDLRRYYWNNTTLAGDGFEYTGTGRELLIGFLIGIAIMVPVYLVITVVSLFGGAVLGPLLVSVLSSFAVPALVLVLGYRGRRYRLARTRYYGVRFHQTGSGLGYLWRTVKWLVLSGLTLGIVYPYFRRAQERYRIENTWYGSAQGSFSAPVKPQMKIWLVFWFSSLVMAGVVVALVVLAQSGMKARAGWMMLSLPFLALFMWGVWVHFRVTEFRTFLAGTEFEGITLQSDLTTRSIIWVQARYILLVVLILAGLFAAMVASAGISLSVPPTEEALQQLFLRPASGAIFLLESVIGIALLLLATEILLRRRLWQLRAQSVTIGNLAALDRIIQLAVKETGGVGDAFDTGFDVAG